MDWDQWNAGGGPRFPHEKAIQFVLRNFSRGASAGKRALDLGCGSGVHSVFLASEGFEVHGLDISPVGVENARARLSERGLSATLDVGNIDASSLPDAVYDLVLCVGVLDSAGVAATNACIPAVHRAMAHGGKAMFLFASEHDFRVRGENPLGIHGFTRSEVEGAFDVGFTELFVDSYITTYRGGASQQNDWLVTAIK